MYAKTRSPVKLITETSNWLIFGSSSNLIRNCLKNSKNIGFYFTILNTYIIVGTTIKLEFS